MGSSPRPPQSRATSGIISINSRVAGGPDTPLDAIGSRVASPGIVFNSQSVGLTTYTVSGAYTGTLVLSAPATGAGATQTVSGKIGLTTFPSPFTLVSGTRGMVLVSAALSPNNAALPPGALIGNVSSAFIYGANATPTTTNLTPGLTYTQPSVSVTMTVANIGSASISPFSITVVVQAILLGALISASAYVQPI